MFIYKRSDSDLRASDATASAIPRENETEEEKGGQLYQGQGTRGKIQGS
jgi:hypothetical protein